MAVLFGEEERRLLTKTLDIRERIADNLIKKELPTRDKDVEAITNLLESIDRSIFNKAKLKIEDESVQSSEEIKRSMMELMLEMKKAATSPLPGDKDVNLPSDITYAINPDELKVGVDDMNLETFKNT